LRVAGFTTLTGAGAGLGAGAGEGGDKGKEEVPALLEPEFAPPQPTAATATKRPSIQGELMRMSANFLKLSLKRLFTPISVDLREYFISSLL
jgi:hypothetical protein